MRNLKEINPIPTAAILVSLVFVLAPDVFAFARQGENPGSDLRKPRAVAELSAIPEPTFSKPPEYFLTEDDVLDIVVWQYLRPQKEEEQAGTDEYLISQGDTLEVSVWQWPDLLKDVIVRPDGKISYPLVGEVEAAGISLTQLQQILTEKLKDYIKLPQVSVMVKQFGTTVYGVGYTGKIIKLPFVKIDDLSTSQVVRPDGKISFPILGDVDTKGLTVEQLSRNLVDKLSVLIKDIQVTVSIKQFGGRKIIVLGEVVTPGVYKPSGEVTLLETIALAGGYTQDAILKNVVVISWLEGEPMAKAYNVLAAMKNADLSQNAVVRGGDIVYVPKSHISNLNYFLTQFIGPLITASSAVPAIRTLKVGTGIPGK